LLIVAGRVTGYGLLMKIEFVGVLWGIFNKFMYICK
jgi:hypothetical protein